jgi:ankyrin repeat protein
MATVMLVTAPLWAGPVEDKALWDAAGCRGHLDTKGVKAALKLRADPSAPSKTALPITPLGCVTMTLSGTRRGDAVNRQALEVAKILIAAGAKLGPADRDILFFPISSGNVEMVRLLIDKGASVTGDLEGYTPTELAKKYGQEAVYQLLVSRGGIPVDSRSSAQLAFVEAAGNGDIDAMEGAATMGAKIDGLDANKQTALVAAVRRTGIYERGRANAIWWLLDHGADPNQKGESGNLPLHMFVLANMYTLGESEKRAEVKALAEETLGRLIKAGAKVSGTDDFGRTPLHVAAKYDNVRAAEILIREGAKVMPRDRTGKTPLDYAESAPMIKLLKVSGAIER